MVFLSKKRAATDLSQNQSVLTLDQIPGIGKKIRERLLNYYLTESQAISALQSGAIGCVPGISYKQALKFAKTYFELHEQLTQEDVLKTSDIQVIYTDLLAHIAQFANTEYSKLKLQLYFPLPLHKRNLIESRKKFSSKALQFVQTFRKELEEKNFSTLMKQVNALQQVEDLPQIRSRIILTDSAQILQKMQEEDLPRIVTVEKFDLNKISDISKTFDAYSKNFNVVIYCGDNSARIPAFSNLIIVPSREFSVASLVPEQIIRVFAFNKKIIAAMIKIVVILKSLRDTSSISSFLQDFDLTRIKMLKENTTILNDQGELLEGIDETLDQYRFIAEEFTSLVLEAENQINDQIKRDIGERSIKIQGKHILDLMRSDMDLAQMRNYIPSEIEDLIEEAMQKALEGLKEQLKLTKHDRDLIDNLLPEVIEFPIQLEAEATDSLEKMISARMHTYKYSVMVKVAERLNETYSYLLKLHQTLLEFDFFYMLGTFGVSYNLTIPEVLLLDSGTRGFFGKDMVNLDLRADEIQFKKSGSVESHTHPTPIPITYQVGQVTSPELHPFSPSRLNLLTGSNSGGKTMCILTCAQSIILAQIGFPSLGEFKFVPFDELYYYKKSSGQLSAGAFETTLLQFVHLAQSPKYKLVFADELESITEPNAASKVLAGIFSLLLQSKSNYGIFVTHLAELLQKEMPPPLRAQVRIDGIEATGLDENLQLIVDRSPKFDFMAKSTPELILTRLARSGSPQQQSFFGSILEKFKKSG
jgi:hypothetical protein